MSFRSSSALIASLVLVASTARAETSVGLFAGYGSESGRLRAGGSTGYGFGMGTRVDDRLRCGLIFGGGLTTHFGSRGRGSDDADVSTYRSAYRALYVGPELGWELRDSSFLLRPYVTGGAWYAFERTSVRAYEINDDRLSPFVAPGMLVGFRTDYGQAGLDLRVPVAETRIGMEAAPTAFVFFGMTTSR